MVCILFKTYRIPEPTDVTISRLFEIPNFQLQNYPQADALAYKENGSWIKLSIEQVIKQINQISYGLLELGVGKGDKVAIVSPNRPEWILMDYAIQQIGAISVPLYPTITTADYRFILKDSAACLVFVEGKTLFDKVQEAVHSLDTVRGVYTFDRIEQAAYWREILREETPALKAQLESLKASVHHDDIATIIYTSGTTGNPKGVMLSHQNILSNALAVGQIFPATGHLVRTLSFLPLCHIFERTASFMSMYLGVSIYFAESLDTIGENLREVKPHYFTAVPRLLEKTYEKIMDSGRSLGGIKRRLFDWSLRLAQQYQLPLRQNWWYRFQLFLANKLVFKKWRAALGGNVGFIVSGAAALHSGIARAFWAAEIPVLEAYGLTETSPGVCFTRLDYRTARIGAVGYPLEGVSVRIADDGEILVKGPNVMKGYYQRPDLTEEVINSEGWLHTGDIGTLSEHNLLKITDRKKEMFKTSGGKYIAPQLLENFFKESQFIDQMMVVGEGEKFPAALIVPAHERLKQWATSRNLTFGTMQELMNAPQVLELFGHIIDEKNRNFAQFEKIKKFSLIPHEWSIDTGELTPTLKLKRRNIHDKYRKEIDAFYR